MSDMTALSARLRGKDEEELWVGKREGRTALAAAGLSVAVA